MHIRDGGPRVEMEVAKKGPRPALHGIVPSGKDSVNLRRLWLQGSLMVSGESPSELNPFLSLLNNSFPPLLSTHGEDCPSTTHNRSVLMIGNGLTLCPPLYPASYPYILVLLSRATVN